MYTLQTYFYFCCPNLRDFSCLIYLFFICYTLFVYCGTKKMAKHFHSQPSSMCLTFSVEWLTYFAWFMMPLRKLKGPNEWKHMVVSFAGEGGENKGVHFLSLLLFVPSSLKGPSLSGQCFFHCKVSCNVAIFSLFHAVPASLGIELLALF